MRKAVRRGREPRSGMAHRAGAPGRVPGRHGYGPADWRFVAL